MAEDLSAERCIPCEGGTPALSCDEARDLLDFAHTWNMDADCTAISKQVTTKNFVASLELANAIGDIAEAEGHHPDLSVSWGKLGVALTTHAVNGLSRNDFVMASKIDDLLDRYSTFHQN